MVQVITSNLLRGTEGFLGYQFGGTFKLEDRHGPNCILIVYKLFSLELTRTFNKKAVKFLGRHKESCAIDLWDGKGRYYLVIT